MLALVPPVPGPIVQAFDYRGSPFARGLHRGIDFAVAAGAAVAAPCPGEVAWADARGLTLVCAGRRVTLLPSPPGRLRLRIAEGSRAAPGEQLATASSAGTLHLGVRRARDPFGYVDPAPLLYRPRSVDPPVAGPGARRRPDDGRPAAPSTRTAPSPRTARSVHAAPELHAAPGARAAASSVATRGLAPWPAWVGLVALLAALAGRRSACGPNAHPRFPPFARGQQPADWEHSEDVRLGHEPVQRRRVGAR